MLGGGEKEQRWLSEGRESVGGRGLFTSVGEGGEKEKRWFSEGRERVLGVEGYLC